MHNALSKRCAIYTRKSTDEGLDQEFNTLDAQREAAEAYIASQQEQGWTVAPERYDDGGFTGANIDRPGLQKLLQHIREGAIQCVIVYKVDRLSRSLLDFARMMELFEQFDVAFVAVTQQINTASSAGRLMLNVLLSFAQFERELISERTRDKMGAARRKGKWLGSSPVLGYDVDKQLRRLLVNSAEASRVREIFRMYLEANSLRDVVRELRRRDWRNKQWQTKRGQTRGGRGFTKATLRFLLTNVTYLGQVRYQQSTFPGEHEPILDVELFEKVRDKLRANRNSTKCGGGAKGVRGVLQGRLYCSICESKMRHTYTTKGKRRYRYYACAEHHGTGSAPCGPAIPAAEFEEYVRRQALDCIDSAILEVTADATSAIRRVDYHAQRGDLRIQFHEAEDD